VYHYIAPVFRRWQVHRNALVIAAIAGTLLNCINQLPELMEGQGINVLKVLLTYMVPYSVSMCSAWLESRNA